MANIILGLKRRGFRSVLLILQLTIGISMLTCAFAELNGIKQFTNEMNGLIPANAVSIYIQSSSSMFEKNAGVELEKLRTFHTALMEQPQVQQVRLYNNWTEDYKLKNVNLSKGINTKIINIKQIFLDKSYIKGISNQLAIGSIQPLLNPVVSENHRYIPIIIGSALTPQYQLGSYITGVYFTGTHFKEIPCVVVGILRKNFIFWAGNGEDIGSNGIQKYNAVIISSNNSWPEELQQQLTTLIYNLQVIPKQGVGEPAFHQKIMSVMSSLGIRGHALSMASLVQQQADSMSRTTTMIFGLSILLMLLSTLGLISLLLISVIRRSHEIGVRYALGATSFSLIKLLGGEIFSSFAVAVFITLALTYELTPLLQPWGFEFSGLSLLESLLSISIVIIASVFLLVIKLYGMRPQELIRGER